MKLRFVIVAVCALLALTPTALAASGGSAGDGYGGNAGDVQQEVNQGALPASAAKGSLPFTGLDLALLVVGGVALLIVGAGLRRAANRPS